MEESSKKRRIRLKGVSVNVNRKNILQLSFYIAFCIVFFALCPYLFRKSTVEGTVPFTLPGALGFGFCVLLRAVLYLLDFDAGQRARRIFTYTALFMVPLFCTFFSEWINGTNLLLSDSLRQFFSERLEKWFGNYLCYLMLFLFIHAVFRRIGITVAVGGIFSFVFSVAMYYTTAFRGTPILPWDFQSFGTAMDVMGNYQFIVTREITVSFFILLILIGVSSKLAVDQQLVTPKQRVKERAASAALCLALFIAIIPMNALEMLGIEVWPWNQKASTRMTGVMAGFIGNVRFLMVETPKDYSAERVSAVKEETDALPDTGFFGEPEDYPTIIAVMNESFTDMVTTANGNLELTEDCMPFVRSLMERNDTISGMAYSSVFGGNTCDSEYEFLTGNSMAFFPIGSKPYQQYVNRDQTSLVSTLKSYGYTNIAVHPGKETAWNRNTAYSFFGFDDFIYSKIFNQPRTTEHGMVSDGSSYDEVIYQYEKHKQTSDDPLFIFNVTIQNHGGFEDENFPTTVQVASDEGTFPEAEQYLSLIKKSDDYFKDLIAYFEREKEPVVVLFFGDHWPNLEDEFFEKILGVEDIDDMSIEDTMRKYEVPFLIWANYPLEGQEISKISMNYLSGLLLRAAGMEGTPYNDYLENLRASIPVITEVGFIDKMGNTYKISDRAGGDSAAYDDLLNEYAIVQYNQAFDKKEKNESFFTVHTEHGLNG